MSNRCFAFACRTLGIFWDPRGCHTHPLAHPHPYTVRSTVYMPEKWSTSFTHDRSQTKKLNVAACSKLLCQIVVSHSHTFLKTRLAAVPQTRNRWLCTGRILETKTKAAYRNRKRRKSHKKNTDIKKFCMSQPALNSYVKSLFRIRMLS